MAQYSHTLCFYHSLTSLHVGCGQDVGIVDLPVIRERTTGYPYVPGSSIRGTFRDLAEAKFPPNSGGPSCEVLTLFGPDGGNVNASEYAGCVAVHDAKIILFPVRSNRGVFAYLTCPFVIARLAREVEFFFPESQPKPISVPPQLLQQMSGLDGSHILKGESSLIGDNLEEFPFSIFSTSPDAGRQLRAFAISIAQTMGRAPDSPEAKWFADHIVFVADDVFDYFIRNATVVTTHNKLTTAKTVAEGQLFSLESVPAETLFYGFIGVTTPRKPNSSLNRERASAKLREALTGSSSSFVGHVTLGGDESTGLGVTRFIWVA